MYVLEQHVITWSIFHFAQFVFNSSVFAKIKGGALDHFHILSLIESPYVLTTSLTFAFNYLFTSFCFRKALSFLYPPLPLQEECLF